MALDENVSDTLKVGIRLASSSPQIRISIGERKISDLNADEIDLSGINEDPPIAVLRYGFGIMHSDVDKDIFLLTRGQGLVKEGGSFKEVARGRFSHDLWVTFPKGSYVEIEDYRRQ